MPFKHFSIGVKYFDWTIVFQDEKKSYSKMYSYCEFWFLYEQQYLHLTLDVSEGRFAFF